MTDSTLERIDQVMDSFDFEKVLKVMKVLDWKYADPDGTLVNPDIARLRRVARSCLRNAYRCSVKYGDDASICGSGGFEARYDPADKEEHEMFTLRFIAEELSSW